MDEKRYLEYGEKEISFLKARDPALGKAMDEIGHISREVIPDIFMALLNSIIGQQISTKAQKTIWQRFMDMFSPVTPEKIALVPEEEIKACGISMRKAQYIKEIAQSIVEGSLNLDELKEMPDEQLCRRLSQIKGIGPWTAQMLMIFSLQRPDIISWDDMAIHRGLRMLHRHREITPELFAKYKKRYSPYGTVASLYIWRISHGMVKGLTDPAPKKERLKKQV
ncbi:MAG: DNA-3-methyladenine glycosylase family protein [Christensenellales bacterium]